MRGGIGVAAAELDGSHVAALAVVNAVGDVIGADGRVVAGSTAPADAPAFPTPAPFEEDASRAQHDVVRRCHRRRVRQGRVRPRRAAARTTGSPVRLRPAHTRFDGDLAIAVATGVVEVHLDRLRVVAAEVVADAIRAAAQ